jgi:calcineurin-like phosphoesterase family protein
VDIHFTSDHHWGHAAARSFYSRPFSSLAGVDQVTEGKYLVVGNNDDATATDCDGWQSIQQYAELVIDGIRLVLCH